MIVVKLWNCCRASDGEVLQVVKCLAAVGVSTFAAKGRKDSGPGLVLLDEQDDDATIALIRELSDHGRERILVLWLGKAPLCSQIKWQLLRSGVSDVLSWAAPDDAQGVAERFQRWKAIDDLVDAPIVSSNLVGKSETWKSVLREVVEVARFTDSSVLLTGESGTGKELVARLIHTLDPRTDKGELVIVDSTTLVPNLSGSELFGHERGAFTGAISERDGAFALADGGTLFIDEIGELPKELQTELLRAIQEGMYKRLGSNTWCKANFRLICATNRDLLTEEKNGGFRRDLYHRIATWPIHLPPLRERRDDIIPLCTYFMNELGRAHVEFDDAIREYLITREYRGNVRELKQLITRIHHRSTNAGPISTGAIATLDYPAPAYPGAMWNNKHLGQAIQQAVLMEVGLKEIRKHIEQLAIDFAIDSENGSLQRASSKLGMTTRALQMRIANRSKDADVYSQCPAPSADGGTPTADA